MVTLKCFKNWHFERQCYPFCRVDNEVCLYKNESTYLHWLTSTRDPILEVVNEICWLSITISSSCRKIRKFWYRIETNIDVGVILIKVSLTFHKLQKNPTCLPTRSGCGQRVSSSFSICIWEMQKNINSS